MRNLRNLTNRKYFSIGNKHPLQKWKFRVGDKVIVRSGRSVTAPELKGFKGATGNIEKINKDPRNPTVEISGISRKVMRLAQDGSKQPKLEPVPIHISKVGLAYEEHGIVVAKRVKWRQFVATRTDGSRKKVKQRVFTTESQERVPDPYTKPPPRTQRIVEDVRAAGPFRLGVTQQAMAHKQTYIPPTRGFGTFASGPLLDLLYRR